jgi:hypothetical protein
MHLHIDTHWDAAGARGEEAVKRHANEAGADSNSQLYSAGVIGSAGSETLACVSDISRCVKATKSPLYQKHIYKSWFIVEVLRVSHPGQQFLREAELYLACSCSMPCNAGRRWRSAHSTLVG